MDAMAIVREAERLGFASLAALGADAAKETLRAWMDTTAESPYPPNMQAMEEELSLYPTVLVLAMPYQNIESYPAGVGTVSGFYPASHRAYLAARELKRFIEEGGTPCAALRFLRLKPLCPAAGIGAYGRNGVIVREGPHIALQALYIDADAAAFPACAYTPMPCERCGACERACPTRALGGGKVDALRCLRRYMDGSEAPPELAPHMGDRLLGCDICLDACPGKTKRPMLERWAELFAFDALLDPTAYAKNRSEIADIVGSNFEKGIPKAALRWRERAPYREQGHA